MSLLYPDQQERFETEYLANETQHPITGSQVIEFRQGGRKPSLVQRLLVVEVPLNDVNEHDLDEIAIGSHVFEHFLNDRVPAATMRKGKSLAVRDLSSEPRTLRAIEALENALPENSTREWHMCH